MKRFSYFMIMSILFLQCFTGCKNHGSDPGEVTLKFLTAVQKSDYSEAKKYATADSKSMLDALSAFQDMLPKASREKFKKGKISIANIKKNDSLAVVTYESDQDSTQKTLKLKKQNGQWKVAFTKQTILPDLNKPITPQDSGLIQQQPAPANE